MPVTLVDADVVRGDGVGPAWLRVDGDRITDVGSGPPPPGDRQSLAGRLLVPGFVDIHAHGGGGGSYTSADHEQIAMAREFHLRHGTTTAVASLVSDTIDALVDQIAALAPFVAEGRIHGIHLEGPWISRDYCGAHNPHLLHPPTPAEVDRVLAAGPITMVTVAPELEGALDATRAFVAAGSLVAVGHTAADQAETVRAVAEGARVATHLFNAMPPLGHRHPGPVGALLADDRVVVEVISDGVHLDPDVLRIVFAAAPGRVALITDAMAAAGGADGDYSLGGLQVKVRGGVARVAASGALAGSLLTMDAALRHAVHVAGIPLGVASVAASSTPARLLGLADRGRIEPGLRADLVVLSDALEVVDVMQGGRWVGR